MDASIFHTHASTIHTAAMCGQHIQIHINMLCIIYFFSYICLLNHQVRNTFWPQTIIISRQALCARTSSIGNIRALFRVCVLHNCVALYHRYTIICAIHKYTYTSHIAYMNLCLHCDKRSRARQHWSAFSSNKTISGCGGVCTAFAVWYADDGARSVESFNLSQIVTQYILRRRRAVHIFVGIAQRWLR